MDLQPRMTPQGPFTRFDNNHINYATGNFGPLSQTPSLVPTGIRAASSQGIESSGPNGRRTPSRQTCCMKLGKKSRRKLTIDKENSKNGGGIGCVSGLGLRSQGPQAREFVGISMK